MGSDQFLHQVSLFRSFNREDTKRLAASVTQQSLKKGEALFRKGSEGNALYIIKEGSIKIVLPGKEGDEVILAIFSDGDFLGEMALLDGMPRSADAVALQASEVYVLSRGDFLAFLKENENAVQSILCSLSMRLRRTDDLLEDTCFLNISDRFAKKLVELAEKFGCRKKNTIFIDLSLTQTDLASMVGATRESINKELRILREKGLVRSEGNRILIFNLDLLKRRSL